MYINLNQTSKKLKRGDLELLIALKQTNFNYLESELSGTDLKRFEELEFIDRVKPKNKKENPLNQLRLSSKGKEFLIKCSYEGSPDEQTSILADWLIKTYKSKSGGVVKNKKEIERQIQWFKTITNISGNRLATLLQCFILDTYSDENGESVRDFMDRNPRGILSNMLDNVCWKAPNHFARNYTLADSPLHSYYEDNMDYIQNVWKNNNLIEEKAV